MFDMYARFRKTYYDKICSRFVEKKNLLRLLTAATEFVKSAIVNVRIEFDCRKNVPANTTAYCLIIHDRVVQYNPLTNVMRKIT